MKFFILLFLVLSFSLAHAIECSPSQLVGTYQTKILLTEVLAGNTVNKENLFAVYEFTLNSDSEGKLSFQLDGFTEQGEALLSMGTVEEKNQMMDQFELLESSQLLVKRVDDKCLIVTSDNNLFAFIGEKFLFTTYIEDNGKEYYGEIMLKK